MDCGILFKTIEKMYGPGVLDCKGGTVANSVAQNYSFTVDFRYITQIGVPCVDSIGTSGGLLHSEDEFI